MHLTRFNITTIFIFLLFSMLNLEAENLKVDESFLSDLKKESFKLQKEGATKEADQLHDSWLDPIYGGYSYSIDNQPEDSKQHSQSAYISVDQAIFKSGGIYFAIKYANALKSANLKNIEEQKKQLIKSVISILYQIKDIEIQLEKQELVIANADIDLERKTELYRNGQLDSSYVDDAMLTKNAQELTKLELENSKRTLIIQLEEVSDVDYKTVTLPKFKLISQEQFVEQDLTLKELAHRIQSTKYYKKMQFSRYFPSVNLTGGVYWNRTENMFMGGMTRDSFNNDYWKIGLAISIPIVDFDRGYSNEIARIDSMEAVLNKKDKERKLETQYSLSIEKLKNIDNKIDLAKKNLELYNNLLAETKEQYDVGRKTELDFKNLENSKEIKNFEIQSLEIEKQLLLIDLV